MSCKYHVIALFLMFSVLPAQETGARYLIIAPDQYVRHLQPLAMWKTQKGLKARIAALSETGSDSTEIKAYIANAYNTWQIRPEYVLLVGNKYQVPFPAVWTYYLNVLSDNYYTNASGDFHNEMLPGRLWVSDTAELKTVVAKILGYEKDPYTADPSWFAKGATIVNEDEPGQPSSDSLYWDDARFVHNHWLEHGFVHIDSFSFNAGHDRYDVIDAINDGRSCIVYRGIGFNDWMWPFDSIYPQYMNNGYKLPIVLSATCATLEGIGRLWQCAGTPEEPTGVVGFYGASTAILAAAEMRSALVRGTIAYMYTDHHATLGMAAEAGRLYYYNEFGDDQEYHSWNCLGDPAMTIWTQTPRNLTVTHTPELFVGACSVSVSVMHNAAPVESALVCIMAIQDTTCYQIGHTDHSGIIMLVDTMNVPGDSVFITVTSSGFIPYTGLVRVLYSGGPYVLLNEFHTIDHPGGNNDSVPNPGEQLEIPFWLKNWGDLTAYTITATLQETEPDEYITLTDTFKTLGNIGPFDSVYSSDNGFNVMISSDCPDSHVVDLSVVIADGYGAEWTSPLGFTVHAPVLDLVDYYFPDSMRYTVPGDTVEFYAEICNTGTYPAVNTIGRLFTTDTLYRAVDSLASFGTLMTRDTVSNHASPFRIATVPSAPACHLLELYLEVTTGVYVDTFPLTLYIGQKDVLVWDPDPNHTSGPIIKNVLDSLGFYAAYAVEFPENYAAIYKSIFICCGVYPNKYVIIDTSRAALDLVCYLEVQNGKVYLEGGDVWVGDPQSVYGYNFCSLFDIEPVSNTIGLFPAVIGQAGTFTQNMEFPYQGELTMLDYIDSTSGSSVIFRNAHNNNGCCVAANNRTVGSVFELGCLVDTISPSTKYVLIDSIMDYFGIPPTGIHTRSVNTVSLPLTMSIRPNPFNNAVTIEHTLMHHDGENAAIDIYDAAGRLIYAWDSDNIRSSNHIIWHGTDLHGRKVPAGVYFVRATHDDALEPNRNAITQKIILLR
jgi:hypothetical protein